MREKNREYERGRVMEKECEKERVQERQGG